MSKAEVGGVYAVAQTKALFRVTEIVHRFIHSSAPGDMTEYVVFCELAPPARMWFCKREEFEGMCYVGPELQEHVDWFQRVPAHEVPPAPRPSWDAYFIQMCHLVSTRATCDRKHVGAVIVRDKRVLSTGYNGSAPGEPHCDDAGHDLVRQADGKENCVRTIHAEANAILQAAKYGVQIEGTTVYTNTYPCWPCAKLILGSGIVEVVVDADYNNDPRVEAAFASKGVVVRRYKLA